MGLCKEEYIALAATNWVAAVRADITTKPIDVMGYEEPVCLLTAKVVKPFEMLVVKVRTKITFTAGCLHCSTLMMDSKDGTLLPGLIVTGACTVMKWGKQNGACCFAQYHRVTYPPQERVKDCSGTSCK